MDKATPAPSNPVAMDVCEKLARLLMRRKYEKVERGDGFGEGGLERHDWIPKQTGKGKMGETSDDGAGAPAVLVPKKFTILSSGNDVVDEVWLNQELRRTIAEGRVDLLRKKLPAQEPRSR